MQEIHEGLDFCAHGDGRDSFGIFSVKFSTDGRELVAGSSDDSIYVYDLETNKLSLRILAHRVMFLHHYLVFTQYASYVCRIFSNILLYCLRCMHRKKEKRTRTIDILMIQTVVILIFIRIYDIELLEKKEEERVDWFVLTCSLNYLIFCCIV